jgi:hypothetical protein
LELFVILRSALLFQGWQPNFQKRLPNFEFAASKFNINCPLTSLASKMTHTNILKIFSNQCIYSKDWWELWIVGRDRKKKPQKFSVVTDVMYMDGSFGLSDLPTVLILYCSLAAAISECSLKPLIGKGQTFGAKNN